jgi:predicted glycosyltransferase
LNAWEKQMNIIISMQHPAHVHKFRYMIDILKRRHNVLVVVIEKEITNYLLDAFGIDFIVIGKNKRGLLKKIFSLISAELRLLYRALKFKPDIFVGGGEPSTAHIAFLLRKPYLAFDDTEGANLIIALYKPFANHILTPECFYKDFGERHIRYQGYHELAYLHPNYFTPNPNILTEIGLQEGEKFVIFRFSAWSATHDIGQKGLSFDSKLKLLREMSKYAKVFISPEGELPEEFKPYQLTIPLEMIHHIIAYATLFIGEGATMASECAVLGTPTIYINSQELGYTTEQEKKFGLVFNFRTSEGVFEKALELIKMENIKEEWRKRRQVLLEEKIDVTAFMVWFIENYPESAATMKTDPDFQFKFK